MCVYIYIYIRVCIRLRIRNARIKGHMQWCEKSNRSEVVSIRSIKLYTYMPLYMCTYVCHVYVPMLWMCTHIEKRVHVCITVKGSAIVREVYASSNRQERNNERAKGRGNACLLDEFDSRYQRACWLDHVPPVPASKAAATKVSLRVPYSQWYPLRGCRIVSCCACAVLVPRCAAPRRAAPRRAAPRRAVPCRAVQCCAVSWRARWPFHELRKTKRACNADTCASRGIMLRRGAHRPGCSVPGSVHSATCDWEKEREIEKEREREREKERKRERE